MRAVWPARLILRLIIQILLRSDYKVRSSSCCSFLHPSPYLFPFKSNHSPQVPLSQIHLIYVLPLSVLHPYQGTNKIAILYVLFFSVVGIATGYGLDGPGFELRWRQETLSYPQPSKPARRSTQSSMQRTPELYRWLARAWRWPHISHLAPRSSMYKAIPLLPLYASHGMFRVDLYILFFTILDSRRKARILWTMWKQAWLEFVISKKMRTPGRKCTQ